MHLNRHRTSWNQNTIYQIIGLAVEVGQCLSTIELLHHVQDVIQVSFGLGVVIEHFMGCLFLLEIVLYCPLLSQNKLTGTTEWLHSALDCIMHFM